MPGSLIVQLGVNIASYIEGFDKASLRAKRFGGELQTHFSNISSSLSGVLSQFGEVGAVVGNAFSSLSGVASSLSIALGGVSGALGDVGIGASVLAVGVLAADSAAIGLAVHAASTASHLYLLSESTGVNIETLSRLSYAANLTGGSIDTISRAVQILDTKMYQAAVSSKGTQTVFERFGIAIKDVHGNLLPVDTVLGEIGNKIRDLGPEAQTTALARLVGGRTGAAALIPIAIQWSDLSKGADEAGVVISASLGKASLQFEQDMKRIQATILGLSLQIEKFLLPTLDTLANTLNSTFKNGDGTFVTLLEDAVKLTAVFADIAIAVGGALVTSFSQLSRVVILSLSLMIEGVEGVYASLDEASQGHFKAAASTAHSAFAAMYTSGKEFLDKSASDWETYGSAVAGVYDIFESLNQKAKPATDLYGTPLKNNSTFSVLDAYRQDHTNTNKPGEPDLTPQGEESQIAKIQDRIATLQTEATAEREAAKAMSEGNSTLAIRKADVEAATEVSRLLAQAVDKSGNSIQAEADIINKSAEAIREWAEEKADATAASSLSEGLQKEIEKLQEQNKAFASSSGNSFIEKETDQLSEWKVALDEAAISLRQIIKDFGAFSPEAEASARALALNTAAFQQAKQAQDTANIDDFIKKTQDQTQELQNQAAAKDALADAYARGDSQGIESASTSLEVAQATSQVQAAKAAFGDLSVQALAAESTLANLIKASSADKYRSMRDEIGKVTEDLRGQALSYDILSAAATGSISAQRDAARVAAEAAFSQKYPNATAATINTVGANALKEFDLKRAQSVQQLRLDTDINQKYYERVTLINAAKAAGGNILTLNAAMDDAQKEANKQWDDAALKVGNYQERLVAIIDILHEQGDNLGEQIANELISSLDKVEDELAKIAVTGKGNFKEVGQSIEESFIKIGEKKAVSVVTGQLEKIPAIAKLLPKAKADGSQANPWYVIPVGGAGGFAKGAAGGIFGSATGILGTGQTPTSGQSGSSGSGGILHDIAKVLGIGGGGDSGSDSGDSGGSSDGSGGGASGGGFGAIGSDLSKIGGAVAKDAVSIGKTIGSFFAKIFGGFFAGGGDVTPGKAYIVGEKGPEWFQPKSAGAIIPNGAARGGSGGGTKQYVTNINVGNVPDADSFKQSESQIYAKAYAAQGFAASRNV